MKFVFFIALAIVASKGDRSVELKFHEDGKDYKEKITFDDVSNTTFIHVPKHGKILQHSDYLIDHNLHYEVRKIEGKQVCYARKMSPEEEITNEALERFIHKLGDQFPRDRYMIENKVLAPMYKLDRTKLSKKINEFCGSLPVVLVQETTIADMERRLNGNRNKRQLLETFVFCTKNGYKPRCPAGQTYKYFCRFQAKTCVYKIQCKRLSSHRGLDCNKAGVPAHVYNSEVCCTSSCS